MDIFYSLIAAVSAIILSLYAWRILNWVWLRPKKFEKSLRQFGFRGNPYNFFHGDLKEIIKMLKNAKSKSINLTDDYVPRVIPHFVDAINKYGKKTFLWLGPKPLLFIQEPELIREILSKNYIFHKPQSNPFTKSLATGLFAHEEDKWAKHRKIINPAFHMEKLKDMLPAFYLSCREILSKWEEIISPNKSCELDVWPHLETMTSDVISRTAFGSSYEEGRRIFELQREQAALVMEAARSIYIPGWRFVPTKRNKRMKEIDGEVRSAIRAIIDHRMKAMEGGNSNSNDLLSVLLDANLKEIKQHGHKDFGMSIEEVIEECKLFYFAGQETTSVLLVWTMVLLSQHLDWQSRAREEVMQVFGNDEPDFDRLNHLKIMTMILYEVLRLYPPIAVLNRRIPKDTNLGNLSLPAGVLLSLPIVLLHHDREIWGDDVKEFKPERFREGVSKATKNQTSVFFPFGLGPRICIGQNFALLEAKMAMAMILRQFSFELSPSYSHAPYSVVTLQPQHGAHLILHKL